jgi:hypothetical protein
LLLAHPQAAFVIFDAPRNGLRDDTGIVLQGLRAVCV